MNRKKERKYLFLIIVIFIAACIETDIYLPAFPEMMVWFSASEGAIQSLLTWNFWVSAFPVHFMALSLMLSGEKTFDVLPLECF